MIALFCRKCYNLIVTSLLPSLLNRFTLDYYCLTVIVSLIATFKLVVLLLYIKLHHIIV